MSSTTVARPARKTSFLTKKLPRTRLLSLLPGLLVAASLAWLSVWLSGYIGVTILGFAKSPISAVMMAVLLGLVISNALPLPASLQPGLTFAVKKVLRLGIIMLGVRLSIFDVFKLGALGVPIVASCIVGALFVTTRLNRWLKLPDRLGALIAVGTSICGVSAIVAASPAIDAEDEEVAYAVAVITIFGIVATLAYPFAAHAIFGGDPVKAGLLLGTSIHDTSQVTGAGLVFSDVFGLPEGLDVATVTKLVRNVFMVAVVPLMAFYYARKSADKDGSEAKKLRIRKLLPLFIVGFLAFAALRSVGDAGVNAGGEAFGLWDGAAWQQTHDFVKGWAVNLLVLALAGVGLSTRFRTLKRLGVKPFLVGLGAALTVGVVSFVAISLMATFVPF